MVQYRAFGGRRGVGLQKVCLAYWNIGSLTGKSIELVKSLHRRRIRIACVQETKWAEKLMGTSCGIRVLAMREMELVFLFSRSGPLCC